MDINNAIKRWEINRGLDKAEPSKQMLKLIEEVGELASGIAKGKKDLIIDSLGDIYVVLYILSIQLKLDFETCVEIAYDEIKDRKGIIKNGVFVKEKDL